MASTRILIIDCIIYLQDVHSLKEKRQIKQSLLATLKNRFNLSVQETDAQDTWQTLVLTLSYVAITPKEASEMNQKLRLIIEEAIDSSGLGYISEWIDAQV